ncbi:MAG: DMT family transporter [Pseudomonadota bacterium]
MITRLNPLSNEQRGTTYAILSGLCYGLLGYFGMSIINANFSIANTTFWRFLVATIVMGIALLPKYKTLLSHPRESLCIFLCGVFLYTPGAMLFFVSSQYIGTGLSIVIFFSFPVMVMLINWYFFNAKMSLMYYISIALIIIGLILLVDTQGLQANIIGIALSFFSAFAYALYIVLSKKIPLPPLLSTFMLSMGCMVSSFIYAYFEGSFVLPMDVRIWCDIIGLGILCTALPILLLLQGLKYISSEKASILSVLEPISIVLVGITMLGETITNVQVLGIIVVLAGAMTTMSPQK